MRNRDSTDIVYMLLGAAFIIIVVTIILVVH